MPKKNFLSTFFILVFFCFLLILLGKSGWLRPLESGSEKLTTPVKMGLYRIQQRALGTIFIFTHFSQETKAMADWQKQTLALQGLSLRSKILEEENLALRQQLEAPLPASMKFLPAKTLGLTRYLIIDKGREDGVLVGQTVVLQNFLVGKVKTVNPGTSEVIVPTDADSLIPVRTLKTASLGLLTGEFGTKATLTKVLQAERLEKDDLLATTGEAGYARDLIVGKIINVVKDEVQPFQKAEINLSLDYSRLENVFLVK